MSELTYGGLVEPLFDDEVVCEIKMTFGKKSIKVGGVNPREQSKMTQMIDCTNIQTKEFNAACLGSALKRVLDNLDFVTFFKIVPSTCHNGDAWEKDSVSALVNEYSDKMRILSIDECGEGSDGCRYDLMVEPETIFNYGVSACKELFLEFVDRLRELEGGSK